MPLSDFLLNLAGKAEQAELNVTVAARLGIEQALAATFGIEAIEAVVTGGRQGLFSDSAFIAGHVLDILEKGESPIGKAMFQALIADPIGLQVGQIQADNLASIATIEKVLGFATELSLGTAAVSAALEPLLGTHGLGRALQTIGRIPENVGLPFFMGTILANVFETATGTPLRESIARQTRPARLEWPQVNRLLRMHEIDAATAADRLANAGFRDSDIDVLKGLERQLLTVSDVETLMAIGYYDIGTTNEYLAKLGLNDVDRAAQLSLFHHRAATEGEVSFRTIARSAFLDGFLSEDTYRNLLGSVETPAETIDLLVAGVNLERDAGRLHLSVSEIKTLYENQQIGTDEVRQRLGNLGMNDADIADLILVWNDGKKVARSGIGTAKILAYLLGGVIDKQTAYDRLVANGMNQKDAQFLVDHPSTHPITKITPIKPSTIVAAYKDDVLTIDDARAELKFLNVDDTEIELLLANATATVTKGKKPKKPTKTLSEANVLDALKLGLAEATWAERELETLGYSADDAALITMIELARLDPKNLQTYGWSVLN